MPGHIGAEVGGEEDGSANPRDLGHAAHGPAGGAILDLRNLVLRGAGITFHTEHCQADGALFYNTSASQEVLSVRLNGQARAKGSRHASVVAVLQDRPAVAETDIGT